MAARRRSSWSAAFAQQPFWWRRLSSHEPLVFNAAIHMLIGRMLAQLEQTRPPWSTTSALCRSFREGLNFDHCHRDPPLLLAAAVEEVRDHAQGGCSRPAVGAAR